MAVHRIVSLFLPLLSALAVTGAHAAALTLDGWTWGQGNMVGVKQPGFEGRAGSFVGTLGGSGVPGLDGPVHAYSVELSPSFSFGSTGTDYTVVDAANYFGADKAEALAQLLGFVVDRQLYTNTRADRRDDLSTALQLAIWNLRYDGDRSLLEGSFRSFATDYAGALPGTHGYWGADALLRASPGAPMPYTLWVLQSPTLQDQLVWMANATVPEPAPWALLGAAGLAAALARRRRVSAAG